MPTLGVSRAVVPAHSDAGLGDDGGRRTNRRCSNVLAGLGAIVDPDDQIEGAGVSLGDLDDGREGKDESDKTPSNGRALQHSGAQQGTPTEAVAGGKAPCSKQRNVNTPPSRAGPQDDLVVFRDPAFNAVAPSGTSAP